MATSLTITKLDYGNTPSGSQTWSFQYKQYNQPDSSYAAIGVSAVNTAGTLATPLTQSGLTPGMLYYVLATQACSSPALSFIQQVQL